MIDYHDGQVGAATARLLGWNTSQAQARLTAIQIFFTAIGEIFRSEPEKSTKRGPDTVYEMALSGVSIPLLLSKLNAY
jgi:hypothetical protein